MLRIRKYNCIGVCTKYEEIILVSKNVAHYGLLLHPLEYLTIYYNENQKDLEHLIKKAEQCLTDNISKSICRFYRQKGYITFKQRKLLLHNFFNCCEEEKQEYGDTTFCQVE